MVRYFGDDSRGKELGIAFSDDISGELTFNVGKLAFTKEEGGRLGINLRYPITTQFEEEKEKLVKILSSEGYSLR